MNEIFKDPIGNYILPFFWQHGEKEEVLREYMGAIQECGIQAVCIEARPHPDFLGDGWWHDMDIILEEAIRRNMKVWILDDAHFPTGMAGGKMKEADISLQKQYIMFKRLEVSGPTPQVCMNISAFAATRQNPLEMMMTPPMFFDQDKIWYEDDSLMKVLAYRCTELEQVESSYLDLTDKVEEGMLEWDIPEGRWAIFILYLTRNGGGKNGYINMLDEDSCRVQIKEVYEPHYEHYKEYFGTTIAGFFSDEPCIGNCSGFAFDESIGRKKMPLPWNQDMPMLLTKAFGEDYLSLLPALWTEFDKKELTAKIRYTYMDAVTTLVGKNFSEQIGVWCEERNVEYIGHIVEDNNQHSRLGSSQGHFFRSMAGQHMSGIDDIGGQVMPEGEHVKRPDMLGKGATGEFYHFELGKLGSSYAHIDPKKQGRAMCEIFGAYGWSEGVRLEKYLTDHFIVRGINHFVPHAFSPKEFPDPDCPPHFYAGGNDPLYRHFGMLMKYMNRMCHLINGGLHVAPAAVLYHGEAEWTGKCMFNEMVACELMEHQIDLDIIPSDVFASPEKYKMTFDSELKVNGEKYQVFIVPYAEYITKEVADFVLQAAAQDFLVVFVNDYPSGICNWDELQSQELIAKIKVSRTVVIGLDDLSRYLREKQLVDLVIEPEFKQLRYYHYEKKGCTYYLINNESIGKVFEGKIHVPVTGKVVLYDGMADRLWQVESKKVSDGTDIFLKLKPFELVVIVFDEDLDTASLPKWSQNLNKSTSLEGKWKVSVAEALEYPNYHYVTDMEPLSNFGKVLPDFSGFICYEKEFEYGSLTGKEILTIEDAYEGVEVFINEQNAGMVICPPYQFEIGNLLQKGKNYIHIEVATTLYKKTMAMGQWGLNAIPGAPQAPTGIIGKVEIFTEEDI